MKFLHVAAMQLLWCLLLGSASFDAWSADAGKAIPPAMASQPPHAAEIDRLQSIVAEQAKQLARIEGQLQSQSKKDDGVSTALLTAGSVILAALFAGFFALRNQNYQAKQSRLLKAVELIMDSRSGYQADIRRKNLEVFLDATTKEHLKDIKTTFAGPEFTDIHLQLAESMAAKAQSPQEVLRIWQAVLQEKNVITKVKYQP